MAHKNPLRTIDLGNWKFVTFVSHTLMVDKKIFKLDYELNNDIMFLARKKKKLRLMCLKMSPWIESKDFNDTLRAAKVSNSGQSSLMMSVKTKANLQRSDIALQVYQTSGTVDIEQLGDMINLNSIVTCQLLTQEVYGQESYILIVQFNDSI
jgi:hypothetical protein